MISKTLLPILLLLQVNAQEICSGKNIESFDSSCREELMPLPLEVSDDSLLPLAKWTWLNKKLEDHKALLRAELDSNKDLFRYVRDGKAPEDENLTWYENEYKNLESDFKFLMNVVEQLNKITYQLNNCMGCSASWRIDKEKEQQSLQKLKISLLSKNPIFGAGEFENIASEDFNEAKFKKAFVVASSSYLSNLQAGIKEVSNYSNKAQKQYEFLMASRPAVQKSRQDEFFKLASSQSELKDDFVSRVLSGLDWKNESADPIFGNIACSYYNKNKDFVDTKEMKAMAIDGTMIVAPFLLGPTFRLGVWGLRGTGLLKWGMRSEVYEAAVSSGMKALSAGYFVNNLSDLEDSRKECSNLFRDFNISKDSKVYEMYKSCESDLSNSIALSLVEVGVSSFATFKSISKAIPKIKNYNFTDNIYEVKSLDDLGHHLVANPLNGDSIAESGFRFRSKGEGDFLALNLSHANTKKPFEKLSDNYWGFVSDVYSERLKLGPEEIKAFIKSSKEMAPRTTLVVNTAKASDSEFRGGVAMVTSAKKEELMPFEKATGFKVDRIDGKRVAEIVRLSVDEKLKDPKLSKKLISTLFSSIKGEGNIDKVYVYTSKSHQVLYKRLRVPMKQIKDLGRDVVLEIDINDIP
ncbi:hypothetical protein [Bacteriovorax sp. Seq25_V]|uniref:hypothetical protein n=1 Tax=Bacteriovorax sp. Seq25_V TaxID=1201288 RepID=UPI000389EC1A|nr:hypothetical protein [Bacteriovorax sp. Seq25_V]EQC44340.1 hypothetical protein M900_A0325 [Bacteriovorax sp. Seq25_V]